METDLYATLGVAPSATTDEIAAAFREHAKTFHPDRHGGDPELADQFKALTNAYAVLIRPSTREAYDRRRAGRSRSAGVAAPTHAPLFKTARTARMALWAGVALVLLGLAGAGAHTSIDTGDAAKTITLWIVVTKLVICGGILWGLGAWRLRQSKTAHRVTAQ